MNAQVDLPIYPAFTFTLVPPTGERLTVFRPDKATVEKTRDKAKAIFVEAFSTTYRGYHEKSRSQEPIEKWLCLKEGLSLHEWLNSTFDSEYDECKSGKKSFVYLYNPQNELLGWLTHGPVSKLGELYLSQCSLEAYSRRKKIAATAFAEALKSHTPKMFPGVKEVKLIARRINERAQSLYTSAGFARDETIEPSVYGERYDDRYVGYRRTITI